MNGISVNGALNPNSDSIIIQGGKYVNSVTICNKSDSPIYIAYGRIVTVFDFEIKGAGSITISAGLDSDLHAFSEGSALWAAIGA